MNSPRYLSPALFALFGLAVGTGIYFATSSPETPALTQAGALVSPTSTEVNTPPHTPTLADFETQPALAKSDKPAVPLFAAAGPSSGQRLVPGSADAIRAQLDGAKLEGRVTPLAADSFEALRRVVKGDAVRLPLADNESAEGVVHLVQQDQRTLRVAGRLHGQYDGSFTVSLGDGGRADGLIQLHTQKLAYRVEQAESAQLALREVPRGDVVCLPLPKMQNEPKPQRAPRSWGQAPPILDSRPASVAVLYLDFDGETVNDPAWDGGNTIVAPPPNVTNAEIVEIYELVREDFWPFDISVTTDVARYNNAPVGSRMRCIMTPNDQAAPGAGGVAYLNSFSRAGTTFSSTIPCWVFNGSVIGISEAISHELGHTFGLLHDGRNSPSEEYFLGHGAGATSWCPIMGASYYVSVSQWSKGEYQSASNLEDDVAIIANTANGFGYIADEAGDTQGTAVGLTFLGGGVIGQAGIVTTAADADYYTFSTTGGSATINVASPVTSGPNLDVEIQLLDSTGAVLATANPAAALNATITRNLPAGGYFLRVDGVGVPNILTSGYSDYGSIGEYQISGTIPGGLSGPPIITSPGSLVSEVNQPLSYQITALNDPVSFDVTGTLPNGVIFTAATGIISGTPTAIGNFPVVVSATNAAGTGTKNVVFVITPTPPPNLHTYLPAGWDNQLVVSTVTGTNTTSTPIESDDPIFLDFAVINDGSLPTEADFTNEIYIDGLLVATFTVPAPFDIDETIETLDVPIGTLSVGSHTIMVKVDAGLDVGETSEADNTFSRTINVVVPALPNLVPHKPASWSDRIVISTVTGTTTDSATLGNTQQLYVDVAIVNDGPVTATDAFTTDIFVDGVLFTTVTTNPPLATNIVSFTTDLNIGLLAAGAHTIRVVTDTGAAVTEISEADNNFVKNFFVEAAGAANLTFFQPSGWSGKMVLSRLAGTRTDSPVITTADTIFMDFTALSNGTQPVGQAWLAKVFVDGIEQPNTINFANPTPPNFTVSGDDYPIGPLTVGSHTIKVVLDAGGTIGETDESPGDNEFTRTINVVNPTAAVGAAKFVGLIRPPANVPQDFGKFGLATVTTSAGGSFTAKASVGTLKLSTKGTLDASGEAGFGKTGATPTAQFKRKGTLPPLVLDLHLAGATGAEQILGDLTENGLAFSDVVTDRTAYSKTVPAPAGIAVRHTAIFPPQKQTIDASLFPQGTGFALVEIGTDGVVKMNGKLADGAEFKFSGPIVSGNRLPLHLLIDKKKTVLNGMVTFRTAANISDFDGEDLSWVKLANNQSPSYPGGWPQGIALSVLGSKYTPGTTSGLSWLPAPGATANANVGLTDAGLPMAGLNAAVIVNAAGSFTTLNSTINQLKLKVNKQTGAITGDFKHPVTGKKTSLEGVSFDIQQTGRGFFLYNGQSGNETISVAP